MIRWLLTGALLVLSAGIASADTPRLFLTWNAPYGAPGATEVINVPCDGAGVDTLYLSFDPGRTSANLLGISASVYFHAPENDTLPAFWKVSDIKRPDSPIRVIYEGDPARGFVTPLHEQALGSAQYDFSSGSGRIRMIYAVGAGGAAGVKAGQIYGYARVLVRHPAKEAMGCGAPLCVEWHLATFGYGPKDEVDTNHGPRWVSINSPGGAVCGSFRGMLEAKPWKPKAGKP